ncbi:MAG: hypothetical protein RL530_144, partial [Actinomycetota bacterium]|jgi:hypothetical protein
MALSEHEQRVLDELERGLYADDEQLARRLKKAAEQTPLRKNQRVAARRIAGSAIALAGLGVILVGAIVHYTWMGLGGFVATLIGLVIATSPAAPNVKEPADLSAGNAGKSSPRRSKRQISSGSISDFFEERWNRRTDGQ